MDDTVDTHQEKCNLDLARQVMKQTDTLVRELTEAVKVLPKVDENGSSDCPLAENLYAKKQEMQEELHDHLGVLEHHQESLAEAGLRMEAGLEAIRSDGDSLHNEQAQDQYSVAAGHLDEALRECYQVQMELKQKVETVRMTLDLTSARDRADPGPWGAKAGRSGGSDTGGASEIDDIFDLDSRSPTTAAADGV